MQEFHKTNASQSKNEAEFEEIYTNENAFIPPNFEKILQDYFNYFAQLPSACLKGIESIEKHSINSISIFDPEIIHKVLLDAFDGIKEVFFEEPGKWENLQKKYLDDLDKLYPFQIILLALRFESYR
jgi:hypothetical protein